MDIEHNVEAALEEQEQQEQWVVEECEEEEVELDISELGETGMVLKGFYNEGKICIDHFSRSVTVGKRFLRHFPFEKILYVQQNERELAVSLRYLRDGQGTTKQFRFKSAKEYHEFTSSILLAMPSITQTSTSVPATVSSIRARNYTFPTSGSEYHGVALTSQTSSQRDGVQFSTLIFHDRKAFSTYSKYSSDLVAIYCTFKGKTDSVPTGYVLLLNTPSLILLAKTAFRTKILGCHEIAPGIAELSVLGSKITLITIELPRGVELNLQRKRLLEDRLCTAGDLPLESEFTVLFGSFHPVLDPETQLDELQQILNTEASLYNYHEDSLESSTEGASPYRVLTMCGDNGAARCIRYVANPALGMVCSDYALAVRRPLCPLHRVRQDTFATSLTIEGLPKQIDEKTGRNKVVTHPFHPSSSSDGEFQMLRIPLADLSHRGLVKIHAFGGTSVTPMASLAQPPYNTRKSVELRFIRGGVLMGSHSVDFILRTEEEKVEKEESDVGSEPDDTPTAVYTPLRQTGKVPLAQAAHGICYDSVGQLLHNTYLGVVRKDAVEWSTGKPIPDRKGCTLTSTSSGIIRCGGLPDGATGRAVRETNIWDGVKWKTAEAMPAGVGFHAAAYCRDKLWVFGGRNENEKACNTMMVYTGGAWKVVDTQNIPAPREGHTLTALDTSLYLFGGSSHKDDGPILGDLHVFNTSTRTWSQPSAVGAPRPRTGHLSSSHNASILISGGWSGGRLHHSDVHFYTPLAGIWRQVFVDTPMPARSWASSCTDPNSQLLIHGGVNPDGTESWEIGTLRIENI